MQKKPKWAVDYAKKESEVPDQLTIIGSAGRGSQVPRQSLSTIGGMQGPHYTGAGQNGIVEPSKPAAMDNSGRNPAMYHEDEIVDQVPGGRIITPSDGMPGFSQAQTEDQQARLGEVEQNGIPGYKCGGMRRYQAANSNLLLWKE